MSRSTASSATNTRSVQNARAKLTKYLKQIDGITTAELEKVARDIKADAIAQTPYRTGKLEASVYVKVSKSKRTPGIVAGASARSEGYNYAGIQHENTKFYHPIKGKAHFISDPFNLHVRKLKATLKRKLRPPV